MSREAIAQVLERASTDAAFREALRRNPEHALQGYDLTPEERAALTSGDAERLDSLGVDARISKLAGGYYYYDTEQDPLGADG